MSDLPARLVSGLVQGYREAPEYHARKAEARARQAQAETSRAINISTRDEQVQLAEAQIQQQVYTTNAQLLQTQTFAALDRYEADGSARHVNNFLAEAKKNPLGMRIYGSYARVDQLTRTPDAERMLKQAGIVDVEGFFNSADLAKRFLLATDTSGNQAILDMNKIYGMTGYTRHMTDRQLQQMEQEARIANLMRQGNTLSQAEQKEKLTQSIMASEGLTYAQAFEKATTIMSTSTDTRGIQSIMEENPELSYDEAAEQWYTLKRSGTGSGVMSNEERYIQDYLQRNPGATRIEATRSYKNLTATSDQKEASAVDSVKAEIDELNFGTEENPVGFFEIYDPEKGIELNTAQRAQLQKYIAKIEKLDPNAQLSTEDKRVARDLRNLYALGGTAGSEITDKETGLIDRTLNTIKKYFINDVGGTEGTAAYESFRNIFRNALYGASLTTGETKAFDKAMGTLGQKTLPVLNQLQTQVESIKNQLETIRDLGDPYVTHYYLGGDIEQVDEIIRALDERIDYFNTAFSPDEDAKVLITPQESTPPVTDGTQTKSLEEIFLESGIEVD